MPNTGLKEKYLVFKADTRKKVDNCFVLRPDRDPAATEALRAYARTTDNETLAEDLYNWVGKGEPVQEWIPVTERLPEDTEMVLIYSEIGNQYVAQHFRGHFYSDGTRIRTSHWMPLPEPPKGE